MMAKSNETEDEEKPDKEKQLHVVESPGLNSYVFKMPLICDTFPFPYFSVQIWYPLHGRSLYNKIVKSGSNVVFFVFSPKVLGGKTH